MKEGKQDPTGKRKQGRALLSPEIVTQITETVDKAVEKLATEQRGQATQARNEDSFLWHFDEEYRDKKKYDHEQWWKLRMKDITKCAVFWELYRRHPDAEAILSHKTEPSNRYQTYIRDHGLKSWVNLPSSIRGDLRDVQAELPVQRGFDPRQLYCVTAQAMSMTPQAALWFDANLHKREDPEAAMILDGARKASEALEPDIKQLAVEHHRARRMLVAVPLDCPNEDRVFKAFKACYKANRSKPERLFRSHLFDWLATVEKFESEMLQLKPTQIIPSNLRRDYRRTIGHFRIFK